ncbi:MAG TPA: hypothetical protein VM509_15055 [Planctomycetota bacterium]|nr:hypothetical protein [Planctomycetota bacterium]
MAEPIPDVEERARSTGLWLIAAVAIFLRTAEACESSLWLDELHTLSHAAQPTLSAVVQHVHDEFHTPLFFLFVHCFGGFEAGAWLRAIPILSSVAMLWPLCAVARECGLGARGTRWTAWLYACMPYQLLYGSELRPYAWIGIFSLFAFQLAFSERGKTPVRLALFFLAILLGLLTHRLMALGLLAIGCARLCAKRERSVPLLGLVAAGALAVAGFLPWLLGFAKTATQLRFDYQERVGGYHVSARLVNELVSLPARLVTPYLRELGGAWGILALVSAAAFAVLAVTFGVLASRTRPRAAASPVLRGLAIFALAQFLVTTAFAVYTWDRVPLQYYTPMAWTIPLLLAWCIERAGDRRWLSMALAGVTLAMGVALVGGKSREDMRGGIAAVRELAASARAETSLEPLYSAVLAQPPQFSDTLPYRAYARDLAPLEPDRVPRAGEKDFERPLIVLCRNVGLKDEALSSITANRHLVRTLTVDRYLTAYRFDP